MKLRATTNMSRRSQAFNVELTVVPGVRLPSGSREASKVASSIVNAVGCIAK